jgi:hypothetical protein
MSTPGAPTPTPAPIEDVRVYKSIPVETKFATAPPWALKSGQKKLAENLGLIEYRKVSTTLKGLYPNDVDKDKWLVNILDEIVNKNCRDDPSLILKRKCVNFSAYLYDLATQYYETNNIGQVDIFKNQVADMEAKQARQGPGKDTEEAAADADADADATATDADADAGDAPTESSEFGNLIITLKIPMDALLARLNPLYTIKERIYQEQMQKLQQLCKALGYTDSGIEMLTINHKLNHIMQKYVDALKLVLGKV